MSDLEPVLTYEETNSPGDNLEATACNGGVTITVEEPWAGDSETGFGADCSVRMSYEDARRFGQWLIDWAEVERTTKRQPPEEAGARNGRSRDEAP